MNLDDVLFGLIVCGIGLAGACFRSEYVLLRQFKETQRSKERIMRKLHLKRLSAPAQPIGSQMPRYADVASCGDPDRHHERDATYDR
jgi:hypothetical protein